jgi:hypothetical protein
MPMAKVGVNAWENGKLNVQILMIRCSNMFRI